MKQAEVDGLLGEGLKSGVVCEEREDGGRVERAERFVASIGFKNDSVGVNEHRLKEVDTDVGHVDGENKKGEGGGDFDAACNGGERTQVFDGIVKDECVGGGDELVLAAADEEFLRVEGAKFGELVLPEGLVVPRNEGFVMAHAA